jgi:cytochrome c553
MAGVVKKIVVSVVVLLVLVVLGGITAIGWQIVFGPTARAVTDRRFEVTEARLARGQYLTEVAACFHCHSEPNLAVPEYPVLPGRRGAGWEMPIPELGKVIAPNITSDPVTGIGAWTDDEVARAVQEGVSRDGSPLFPIMPYMNFRNLTDEDLASLVVYLRTIPPVSQVRERSTLIFPLSVLVNVMPQPLPVHTPVERTTPVARGEYLVRTVAGCADCHSPAHDGNPLDGMDLGGGFMLSDPGRNMAPVHSANITSDPSGIAHYDEAMFISVLRTGHLPGRMLNHIMPFENYRNITDDDMRDIFAYLQSVPPVKHRVSNVDPATLCPLCGSTHGLGDKNVKAQ